jgi:Protein of unknown function (DUF3579).
VLTHDATSVVEAGVKRLTVVGEMRCACPDAFDFVARFARDNDLPVQALIQPVVESGQARTGQSIQLALRKGGLRRTSY